MKPLYICIVLVSLLILGACQPGGVGDPCDPVSCPAPLDDSLSWLRCDWLSTEIYLEGRSLQCRTRVCMVFRVDSDYQDPTEIMGLPESPRAPYCTRPCGAGTTYEDCPPDYCCMKIITAGESSATGNYCVRKEDLATVGDPRKIPPADCALISQCYEAGSVAGTVDSYMPQECSTP